ncbi:helix-turn-helix DNA binding domain protein [Microbacterium phage Pepe25]|nr:helix-turn-helix DNA binding domain protein [Microbacterium phage Pepe25]UVT31280.1 helix-turn-helix DNA binding domain protein [Microbacterium phage Marcie]
MTENANDLLTPEEVAEKLRVAVSTLERWRRDTRKRKEQIGPYWVELPGRVAYRREALNDYISSREQRADG